MMAEGHQKVMQGERAPERYTFRVIDKEGKTIYVEGSFRRLKDEGQIIGTLGVLRDVTEKIRLEQELRGLSITDDLTGLYNQRHFYRELEKEMERSKRQGTPLCLLLFDLDEFKAYNDTHGHLEGDKILSELAQAALEAIRKIDSAYRYGGDEFTVILPGAGEEEGALVGERLRKSCEKNPLLQGITLSIGLVEFNPQQDLPNFIKCADDAMYSAKKMGGNRIFVFPKGMREVTGGR
jgi:diguanylate cyclase (GGDEF)-like protein